MDIFYQLCLLFLFELMMLIGLFQYYISSTRTTQEAGGAVYARWLSYGVPVLMLGQICNLFLSMSDAHFSLYILAALLRLLFYGFLVCALMSALEEPLPLRWLQSAGLIFVLVAVSSLIEGIDPMSLWAYLQVPSLILLSYALFVVAKKLRVLRLGLSVLCFVLLLCLGTQIRLVFAMDFSVLESYWLCGLLIMLLVAFLVSDVDRLNEVGNHQRKMLKNYVADNQKLESQFHVAQKMEGMGLLSAGIAHDVNNMLTSILGYTKLALKKLPEDSTVKEDLYMVMSGARQGADLTGQMLNYTQDKYAQGKGPKFESLNLSRLVEEMTRLMTSITPKKIHLAFKLPSDIPVFKGDRIQISQILLNLVANAADAIEASVGVIEVHTGMVHVSADTLGECQLKEHQQPGNFLFLQVEDNGKGIEALDMDRIFEPFFSKKKGNKGLGLSSLLGLVKQHNGFLRVVSTVGEGSRFTVYLPIADEKDSPATTGAFEQGLSRGMVLIADDDQRIKSLMSSILESDHFQSVSASDGKEVLSIFEKYSDKFSAVVLDCAMPKMSGSEVYKNIRALNEFLPIVLVSGFDQREIEADIDDDVHAYFIKKPFDVDEFIGLVNLAIKGTSHVASPEAVQEMPTG